MNEQSEVLRGRLHFLLPPFLFTRPQTHASTSAWSSAPSFHLSAICPSLYPVGLHLGALPCSCVLASLSPCPARPQQSLRVQPEGTRALGPLWFHSQHGQVTQSIAKRTRTGISMGSLRPQLSSAQASGSRERGPLDSDNIRNSGGGKV